MATTKKAATKTAKKPTRKKGTGLKTAPLDPPEAPAATAADHQQAMMGDRDQMIRQEAYYRAQRRGFAGGDPEQDWLEAEAEVDERLDRQSQE